jgi:protein-disulfide isomerase
MRINTVVTPSYGMIAQRQREADYSCAHSKNAEDDPISRAALCPCHHVEFSDYRCPFCARLAPTLARVEATYGVASLPDHDT